MTPQAMTFGNGSSVDPMTAGQWAWGPVTLTDYQLTVSGGPLTIDLDGNMTLNAGSVLTFMGAFPDEIVNDGQLSVNGHSTLSAQEVAGSGTISANNGSTIVANGGDWASSENVVLNRSNLMISENPGMQFLSSVNLEDSSSEVVLRGVHAAFESYGLNSDVLSLYGFGGQLLDQMRVMGNGLVWARESDAGGVWSTVLTASPGMPQGHIGFHVT